MISGRKADENNRELGWNRALLTRFVGGLPRGVIPLQLSKKWGQVYGVNMEEKTPEIAGANRHFANLRYYEIQSLEYQLLLLGDLVFLDNKQRKAYRNLVRRTIWLNWAAHLEDRTDPTVPVGMPNLALAFED
jgi:hypothetical protein